MSLSQVSSTSGEMSGVWQEKNSGRMENTGTGSKGFFLSNEEDKRGVEGWKEQSKEGNGKEFQIG